MLCLLECKNAYFSYFSGGDKPYLISGADDKTVKVIHIREKLV
jgi:hypothetical protein